MSNNSDDEYDDSVSNNGSHVSTVPDRHGFIGGAQYSPVPKRLSSPAVILKRERKWLQMIQNWDKFMTHNYKKVRERCRKGIPPSVRQRAWLYLSGAKQMMDREPYTFSELCKQEGDPRWVDDIRKDLHRQFPYHEMFVDQEGHGQKDLFNVLKAYSIYDKSVGYCQAQAPIAAFLLTRMPAHEAFWCLVSVCRNYICGYYNAGMETLQIDGQILFGLLKKVSPNIYKHLKKQQIEPIMYMTEWFLCVFTRTLPWATILRIWDVFFCEGMKILFKVALVVLKLSLNSKSMPLKKKFPTMYETLDALRNPPLHILDEDFVVREMFRLKLTDEDFEHEHHRQMVRRRSKQQQSKDER